MNARNDISEELRLLSAVVAAISRQTPYEVPRDYFLDLPARVLLRVSGQHVRGQGEHKQLTFSVPEGYFEGFARQVLDRIKTGGVASGGLAAEAGEDPFSSILAEIGRRTPYSV